MKIKSICIFIMLFVLPMLGCGGPGAPLLRRSADDGEGPLVPDCKNVASTAKVDDYNTGSYLSTWGSALVEGAMEGAVEGATSGAGRGLLGRLAIKDFGANRQPSKTLNHLPVPPSPYCRVYAASAREVSAVIADLVSLLGNPILTSDVDSGVFITDFIERRHRAARWRDSYEITVTGESPKRTVVHILRKLYISRTPGVFNQAISVGHNEAWIMTQIAERLKESGSAGRH